MFHVSPVSPGSLMRPSGAAVQQPGASAPFPQVLDTFTDPLLGDPIAFAQCALIPGSDTPLTLPEYTMPSGLAYMLGQSSVQTVMASAASSRPEGWSSDTPRTVDISREAHLMLILPRWIRKIALWLRRDCRAVRIELRLTPGRPSPIRIQHLECSSITPGSWSLLVRQSPLGCCIIR